MDSISFLEEVLNYHFIAKSVLNEALTAPGAEGDKEGTAEEKAKYEGNRLLARFSKCVLPLLALGRRCPQRNSESCSTAKKALECAIAAKDYTIRATALRIPGSMKLSPRQRGVVAEETLRQAIYAIIGAIWQDSDENLRRTEKAVERLFIGTEILLETASQELASNPTNLNLDNPESSLLPRQITQISASYNFIPTTTTEGREGDQHQLQPGQDSSTIGTARKKRKASTNNSESRQIIQLTRCLARDEQRCLRTGLPFSSMDSGIAFNGLQLPPRDSGLAIKTLSYVIASPESIVALQEIIIAHRTSVAQKQFMGEFRGDCNLSLADRVKAIKDAGSEIAYLLFMKRCHTHQLFVDCSKGSRRTSDGFVVDTVQSLSNQASSRLGNPQNLEDSMVAEEIIKEVYPNLTPGTELYQKKKRFVHRLRKLGERFDVLVNSFSYGILGLLSWPQGDLLDLPVLSNADEL
ncbi:hypothetical protein WAI453_013086 [Rhynchosporium graminicola]|uniref:RNase III domain-containing protein n=1 Tax=Rhynchosporium graminicola TaxID=2792576 RepID=A0A1E1K8B8_9HELO|nr:uncharacterized protein RCO7_10304 [Rhynchosporium commune]